MTTTVGIELQGILIDAAQRGVKVVVSLDGFGCGELRPAFLGALAEAGVTVQMFDPASKTLGLCTNWFRRLHRKIVVVDASVAFIGGINFSADTWLTSARRPNRIMPCGSVARRWLMFIISRWRKVVARCAHGAVGGGASNGLHRGRLMPATV